MEHDVVVHSSQVEPDRLNRLIADQIARDQIQRFRRYFLVRLGVVAAALWVLAWPIPLLPHTLLWSLLATAVFVIGLMSPRRSHEATEDTERTPMHRGQ
jgi:hypothetical protein